MSRLDDELKEAFRRHEPSPDFAARVIDLATRQAEPTKNGWRQMLTALFQPPKLRWVAIGVTASLLIALAAGAYRNSDRAHRPPIVADVPAGVEPSGAPQQPPAVSDSHRETQFVRPVTSPTIGKTAHRRHHLGAAQREQQRELRAEAEAAKEKVLFALQICSATLKDAQRSIQDDSYKSKP